LQALRHFANGFEFYGVLCSGGGFSLLCSVFFGGKSLLRFLNSTLARGENLCLVVNPAA
jgi:hypothetical protein